MTEYDLVLMSLVIFVPAAFGLRRPARSRRGGPKGVRWWALVGTGGDARPQPVPARSTTTRCSTATSDRGLRSLHHPETPLDARVDEAMRASRTPPRRDPQRRLRLGRAVPWIARFDIDYALGVDGIRCRSSC